MAYSKDDIMYLERAFSHLIRARLEPFKNKLTTLQAQQNVWIPLYENYNKWLAAAKNGPVSLSIQQQLRTSGLSPSVLNQTLLRTWWESNKNLYKINIDGYNTSIKEAKKDLDNEMVYLQPALTLLEKRELPNNFNPPEYIPNSNNTTATATRGGKKRRSNKTRKNRK
jgi:hypothetical protein